MGLVHDATKKPPGFDVTIYSIIPVPPSLNGGENEIVACSFPHVARALRGGVGTVTGIILFEAVLAVPVPAAFTATTVNVYVTPFVSQVRRIGLFNPVNVIFHGDEVTA